MVNLSFDVINKGRFCLLGMRVEDGDEVSDWASIRMT